MSTYTTPISGTYVADPIHSSFGFAVKYMGGATYRGTMDTVSARLVAGPDGIALAGSAEVESISIRTPQPFRAHVLGEQFFDADHHPEVTFRSDNVVLDENGSATVEGQLTIKSISHPVTARGAWAAPVADPTGKTRATLALEATISRRDYGINWDTLMPDGRPALADDVTLTVDLFLVAENQD
jgi:polyisoprenoid-binding protein YceI